MRDSNPGFKSDSGIFNGYKLWVQVTGCRVQGGSGYAGTLYPAPCTLNPAP